jgi:hypothetical protein
VRRTSSAHEPRLDPLRLDEHGSGKDVHIAATEDGDMIDAIHQWNDDSIAHDCGRSEL